MTDARAFTTREIASALGVSQQAADKRAKRENWHFSMARGRGGRRRVYDLADLPHDVQSALLVSQSAKLPQADRSASKNDSQPQTDSSRTVRHGRSREASYTYDAQQLWTWASQRPKRLQDEAKRRAEALDQVMTLVDHGTTFRVAAEQVAARRGDCSPASIRNWYYGANGQRGARDYARHDWPAALIPRYAGRQAAADIDPTAWDYFKADYLRLEAPTAQACFRRLTKLAKKEGWTIPSCKTLLRRLENEVGKPAIVLARQGSEALRRLYPAQERDRTIFRAMEAVNADGHKWDVFVKWPDGTIDRPMMVAWQDLYSGTILSWRVGRSENTDSYRLSVHDLLRDYGIFNAVWLDNGRGIASKYLTGGTPNRYRFKVLAEEPVGLLTQLVGSKNIHWTTPYSGQSKPIERAFRDLAEDIAKDPRFAGAYTGNKPTAKPENYASHAVDIDTFIRVVEEGIQEHNARPGRRSVVANGRSFDEVFWESYNENAHHIPKPTDQQLRQWLLAAESITADRHNGEIRFMGNRYWDERLARLAGLPAARRKVVVYFDPDHLHDGVHVYALDGREIGYAECMQATGFADTQTGREHNRARTQYRRATKEQLEAQRRMDINQAGQLLDDAHEDGPDPDEPKESRIVRGAFRQPQKRVAGSDVMPLDQDDGEEADERYGFADLIEAQRKEWIDEQI